MRFLGGLLFHVGRVVVGLLVVVAVIGGLIVGGVWYLRHSSDDEDRVAEALKQQPVIAVEAPPIAAPGTPKPAVRVVTPPAAARPEPEAPAEQPPPAPRIDAIGKIDQATRDYFDKVKYLVETGTQSDPKTCDGRVDWILWVSLYETWRSEITRDESSTAEALGFFLTMGASTLVGPGNERWTIFTGETAGRYITFTLGETRRDSSWDKVGALTRMTFYRMDDKRLGLVEQAPIQTPPAVRPAKKAPKIERVYLVCRDKA